MPIISHILISLERTVSSAKKLWNLSQTAKVEETLESEDLDLILGFTADWFTSDKTYRLPNF